MGKKRLLKYTLLLLVSFSVAVPSLWSQPMNDVCTSAILIDETGMIEGSTLQATTDESGAICNSLRVGTKGVWYKFMGTGKMITFSTCLTETLFDTWIAVYSGDCDALVCEAQNDNEGACTVANASELDFLAEKGKIYYILIGGVGVNTVGTFKLATFCPGGGSDCIQKDECPDEDRITKAVCGCGKTDYSTDGERPNIIKYAPLTIGHPTNDTTCLYETAQFGITATAGTEEATLAYRWQVANLVNFSNNGLINYTDISDDAVYQGSQTNTLQIVKATQNLDELKYRVIVTQTLGNTNCLDTSDVATLYVFTPPTVSVSPQTDTICVTNDAKFSMEVIAGEATANLTYRWQVSTNKGNTFGDLMDNSIYQGSQTKQLSLSNVAHELDEYQYRMIVTQTIGNFSCYDTTDIANLYVFQPPIISLNPQTDTVCVSNNFEFSMETSLGETAGELTYHWQVSTDAGLQFMDIADNTLYQGTKTPKLSIINSPHSLDEYQYRAIATQTIGTNHCFDTTAVASFYVFVPPSITVNPTNSAICVQQGTAFSTEINSTENGTLSYEWQVSSNEGQQFIPLPDNELYRQTNSAELKIDKALFSLNQQLYRLIVKEKIGTIICQDTSTAALLTVMDNPKINREGQQFTDICGDMIDISGANTPNSTGSWSFVSATPESSAIFSDPDKITTFVTGVYGGQYTLRWTVNSGVCQGRTADLQISFNPDEDLLGGLPDGTQDCVDLCIGGDDRINTDGSGLPDDCDCLPNDATNEFANITNTAFQLFVREHVLLGLDTLFRKGDFSLMADAVIGSKMDNFPPVIFQAAQSITLIEGFHAKAGASFKAQIGFCRDPLANIGTTIENDATRVAVPPQLGHQLQSNTTMQWEVFPTIVQEQAVMQLYLPEKNQITLALYDQHGRFIKTYLPSSQYKAGQHHFLLNTTNLVGGMYILRLVGGTEVLSQRIIVQ
ncbi:MAG: 3-coathanger stack domain-containing protein [Saprospiraceae bacterium]